MTLFDDAFLANKEAAAFIRRDDIKTPFFYGNSLQPSGDSTWEESEPDQSVFERLVFVGSEKVSFEENVHTISDLFERDARRYSIGFVDN